MAIRIKHDMDPIVAGNIQSRPDLNVMLLGEANAANRLTGPILRTFRALDAEAAYVSVTARGTLHDGLESEGISAYSLDCRAARDYPAAVVRLSRLAGRVGANVLFAVEPIAAVLAGLTRMIAPELSVIYNRQHVSSHLWQQTALSRFAASLADQVVCVSQASADAARELDAAPPTRLRVVHSGIPELRPVAPADIERLRRQIGIPSGHRVIVIVARLRAEKGHRTLLAALPLIRAQVTDPVDVVIVGDGPDEEELRQLAAPLGAGVYFAGNQPDVAPWFALADVIAIPSYREAFGLSAAEAMCMQRPLVASRVGGLPEIVNDGDSGILVAPQNPQALAAGIIRILSARDFALQLGAEARRVYLARFTVDAMVAGWARCCRDVVRMNSRG